MAKFEIVSRFADAGLALPTRGTAQSAGYDLCVAEDIDIPAYEDLSAIMTMYATQSPADIFTAIFTKDGNVESIAFTLDEMAKMTKETKCKPTLVSTGVKCKLNSNEYLQLSARSSTPLKYWLVVANAPGIVDADYYNNPDNEGEIFLQMINLSPYTIKLKKGDKIGQGIIKTYSVVEDDVAGGDRTGGHGSTGV